MIGAEIVSAANRVTPIHPETRPMWVQTQVAQQLGLRDGQVVQAMVEVRDKRVRLWVKDFFFELPNGWVLKDGDKPFLRASHSPAGWGFLIQSYPPGQTSSASPASASFGLKNMDWQGIEPRNATTLGMLLTQPTGFVGGAHAGYGVYACKDGRVAVAALEPHFAAALCAAAGVATSSVASLQSPATHTAIARFLKKQTRVQLNALALAHDIPLHTMA